MNTKTYVTYLMPGVFMPEEYSREVTERNPEQIAQEADHNVFGFYFYDIAETEQGGVKMRSNALNKSPYYYIDAKKWSLEEVEFIHGKDSILASNMRSNHWDTVVRCRTGNFRPLDENDVIVSSWKR